MPMRNVNDLSRALASVQDPGAPDGRELGDGIAASVRYLDSEAALRSLEADACWPKWDSPWWHMLLLHELGEARRIPERTVARLIVALNGLPVHVFPIRPEELPPGADPRRHAQCHCALGCITQLLVACGVEVDRALPWVPPWFLRYQMADGGLNCDATAYLVADECPSSMVATIAPFEAVQLLPPDEERTAFLERAAGFLVARRLMLGSPTHHNREEREREASWRAPCFPRFYFYDVLRGLRALVRWALATGRPVPLRAVSAVVEHLVASFADGIIRVGRRATEGWTSLAPSEAGAWSRQPASTFELLELASAVGRPSAALTRAWTATRRDLVELAARRLIVDGP
jgi:hypothetical protein